MITYVSPQTEMTIRFGIFFAILAVISILEIRFPRRQKSAPKAKRWVSHLAITFINSFFIRILFPTAAIGVAFYAQQAQIGLFNNVSALTGWVGIFLSVIILDGVIYLQHMMFHAIPFFWRFHRMHHIDLDFDVSTGFRFHPIEIFFSLLIKFGAILLIGVPPIAVLIFEVVLNATSMFNHSNIYIPLQFDRVLRWLIVTPDMHRVHHSEIPHETNSNFGFNLPIWDRIFGTYTDQPQWGHAKMTIGIKTIRSPGYCINLFGMLCTPFMKDREYPLNR